MVDDVGGRCIACFWGNIEIQAVAMGLMLQLTVEGDVLAFLGIQFEPNAKGAIKLT
jgi:hypothetical protein